MAHLRTRKILDRSFTGFGFISIFFMALALLVLLVPIFIKGSSAFFFQGTVEFRRFQLDTFGRGNAAKIHEEVERSRKMAKPIYDKIAYFRENELPEYSYAERRDFNNDLEEIEENLYKLLGPQPGTEPHSVLPSDNYGRTRWDGRTKLLVGLVMNREEWYYGESGNEEGRLRQVSRTDDFKGTSMEEFFPWFETIIKDILNPRLTCYWRFLFDESRDSHFFGGIWPEVLGTFYLTLGSMLFAVPLGIIVAIFLAEFAKEGKFVSLLRTCISTLAGVPSIVFGLFGLAFFINTMHVSSNKSVLAGSMTLAILILPTIIRAAEEAIRSVPHTYKEAALSLGATKWGTVLKVILPAALPGILTGIVISMGRAAGETAPIIFTAAVSVGKPLKLFEVFNNGTPALSWNIYNLATEHEAVDEIRHVQYGMVLTLILLVLTLNLFAIILRARISKKLRG